MKEGHTYADSDVLAHSDVPEEIYKIITIKLSQRIIWIAGSADFIVCLAIDYDYGVQVPYNYIISDQNYM